LLIFWIGQDWFVGEKAQLPHFTTGRAVEAETHNYNKSNNLQNPSTLAQASLWLAEVRPQKLALSAREC
jgi:hypothetical protein